MESQGNEEVMNVDEPASELTPSDIPKSEDKPESKDG